MTNKRQTKTKISIEVELRRFSLFLCMKPFCEIHKNKAKSRTICVKGKLIRDHSIKGYVKVL